MDILTGLFVLAAGLFLGGSVLAVRRQSPATTLFAAVAGIAGIGALPLAVGFGTGRPNLVLFSAIAVGLLLPVAWILFSFDYVGQEALVSARTGGLIAVPVAIGVTATTFIFAGQVLPWFDIPPNELAPETARLLSTVLSLTQWFALLYAGGLVLTGGGLILWTFQRYPHLDSTTGIALGTVGIVPWLSILFGLQLESVSTVALGGTTATGFLIGGIATVALVGPSPLFDRVPSAGNVGPATVIEELTDLVVVVDSNETVVELNDTAAQLFDGGANAVGRPIDALLDASIRELRQQSVVRLDSTDGQTLFEPTVSDLTDQHGNPLGYAVVLRDVTVRTTRRQQLEVLNRLLRHNLRNDMTVIVGHAELIRDQAADSTLTESGEVIVEKGTGLVDISEKARSAEELISAESATAPTDIEVRTLVRDVFETVEESYDADYQYHGPDDIVVTLSRERLRLALENLVENAVEHNDSQHPRVEVRARYEDAAPYPLELSVTDNGPGIPAHERNAIEAGQETALEHTSGIGLWIVRWVITSFGGKISFPEDDGSTVVLSLPNARREPQKRDTM